MANPSLQIGNSNWAIKEDNLLGYSTAGTRFLPQPITMTRASAGTRVNPQGLIETVELLGSDLIFNGDFATDTDWVKLNGSTISGGVGNVIANGAINSTGGNWSLNQVNIFAYNITYKVNFKARQTGGTGNFQVGQGYQIGFNESITSAFVEYSFYITGTSVSGNANDFIISIGGATIGDTFEIDNVSVKESTKNNLARVDYDGTASSLLVEPQRTNLLTYSEDFSQWTVDRVTVSENQIISPNGTLNADSIAENSENNIHRIYNGSITLTGNVYYTITVFAKKGNSNVIQLTPTSTSAIGSGRANFDLENGVLGAVSGGTAEIKDYGNGWYRCSYSFEALATATSAIAVNLVNDDLNAVRNFTYLGNINNNVYLWGAQTEAGSYATSYIPTSGSSVTRVADQYTKTGISNLIGQTEGTMFVDFDINRAPSSTDRVAILNNGTGSERIGIALSSGGLIYAFIVNGNVTQIEILSSGNTAGRFKAALAYKANDFAFYINGILIGTDINGTVPYCSRFDLGNQLGIQYLGGNINQAQLYKTRLSNPELATLTTI